MLSPLYFIGPLLLLLISIPLAFSAIVTTFLALFILIVRASIVYFELGVALLNSWLLGRPSAYARKRALPPFSRSSSGRASPTQTRIQRNNSITSTTSSHGPTAMTQLNNKSGSFASLIFSGEPNRDFEGVGGWRVFGEDNEEAIWIGMNSRLELPTVIPPRKRNHKRSLTGG
ncbi:hypothetical protein GQ43DRAFT_356385, partial [Delitschia confertaspora ATCC 74209]